MSLAQIVAEICASDAPLVVFTGGEPGLQLDRELVEAVRQTGRRVAVETNGTCNLPEVDWLCVSPKAGTKVVITIADELKVVYPQSDLLPQDAAHITYAPVKWISPKDDGVYSATNMMSAIEFVKINPDWRLNIQAHKVWGIE